MPNAKNIKRDEEFTESRFFVNPARAPLTRAQNDYFVRKELEAAYRGNYPVGYTGYDD